MSNRIEEVPVLVVGAGPAGLTAATTLARYGVESLLVEKRAEPSTVPRATAVSTATMELLRSWGIEDSIRAGEIGVELRPWVTETLAGAAAGEAVDAGFPSREQSLLLSPTAPAGVAQDHLEPVLEEHFESLGIGRLERGTAVTGLKRHRDGFEAALVDEAGRERRIFASHLIGADGPRGTVRPALGIAASGPGEIGERRMALFRAPLWDLVGEHRYTIYFLAGKDPSAAFVPADRADRWIFASEYDPADAAALTPEGMTDTIRRAAGDPGLEPRFERIETVTYGVALADRFRDGNAFLIGDAAHRVTPRGATGLNTAIRDGHDLGWKLAWVLRGWADEGLLDSYEDERRPIAEHNAARSADPSGSIRDTASELRADLGGRIAHLWVGGQEGRTSTLDLLDPGLTLFTGPEPGPWPTAAASLGEGAPVTLRPLDELSARALGIRSGGALLARPDGLPVALWDSPMAMGRSPVEVPVC
jgi:2-polyprenyl-6-methoxyphenol hydroxylase-like FAD-dependent oxidoreductase